MVRIVGTIGKRDLIQNKLVIMCTINYKFNKFQ